MITSKEKQKKIIKEMHKCPVGGHQGIQHTYEGLKLYVTWPGMFQDVEAYIKNCLIFQKNKFTFILILLVPYTLQRMVISISSHVKITLANT
jgi:hypothetical protein